SEAWLAAHRVQHELLMVVAAPLVAVSASLTVFLWALPAAPRRRLVSVVRRRPATTVWAVLTAPGVAWLLHAAALWTWHLPKLYDYAATHEGAHLVEHAS